MGGENNSITGTWVSTDGGAFFVGGTVTQFRATVTETGEVFNATSTAFGLSVSALPGSVSAGGFTFNGPKGSFLGWSGGVSAESVVAVSYSGTSDQRLRLRRDDRLSVAGTALLGKSL